MATNATSRADRGNVTSCPEGGAAHGREADRETHAFASVRANELLVTHKEDDQVVLPPRELNIVDIVMIEVRIYLRFQFGSLGRIVVEIKDINLHTDRLPSGSKILAATPVSDGSV
ncbi:hypothetical protein GCM10027355_36100 [Haloplanus salinarum]|uniref:hypothetical protein n=1 Tax=Haloplanus salinarum TaxID=1912324 RepID=UPI003B4304F1